MKNLTGVAILLTMIAAAVADERATDTAELVSLHGTMITMISEREGLPAEIWAKGNNVRTESERGGQKIISIQLGDTVYTYAKNSVRGNKTKFAAGLASMGLIKQIAEVRSKGEKQASGELDGVVYDEFLYTEKNPQEWATVNLARKTSLPSTWISAIRTGDKKGIAFRLLYRNMEANVEVPDDLFTIPPGINFTDVSPTGLMATAPKERVEQQPTPELKSLHGTILERVREDEDKQFEIWAKGDNDRIVHTVKNHKIVNLKVGPTMYIYVEGLPKGKQQLAPRGLRSKGLIKRIEEIKTKGTKIGPQEIEGNQFVKYTYDFDSSKESGVVYLSAETSLPGLWIGKEITDGKTLALVTQYRKMEANVEIADDMFALPRGVTFSK